ncbi:MAG: hypothetical protein H3C47_06670 [Candidatus Cloacimonetes bacterium]|nr:hypothetical protein [Candidatus Cloacimonadota bacterium]
MKYFIFVILFTVWSETFELELGPTFGLKLILKSGEILEADLIGMENEGLAEFRQVDKEFFLPLNYFMPQGQKYLQSLKPYIPDRKELPTGTYGTEFVKLSNFADLRKLQVETAQTALVLIDPTEEFQSAFTSLLKRSPVLLADVTYFPKYMFGKDADATQLEAIIKQYAVTPPAMLIVGKERPIKGHSAIASVNQAKLVIEPLVQEGRRATNPTIPASSD